MFERAPDRAFVGTYQLLGYLRDERLVQLAPHRRVASLKPAMRADLVQPAIADDPAATLQAVSFYETAAHAFRDGGMRNGVPMRESQPDDRVKPAADAPVAQSPRMNSAAGAMPD